MGSLFKRGTDKIGHVQKSVIEGKQTLNNALCRKAETLRLFGLEKSWSFGQHVGVGVGGRRRDIIDTFKVGNAGQNKYAIL